MKCRLLKMIFEIFKIITFFPLLFIVALLHIPFYIVTGKSLLDMHGMFIIHEIECEKNKEKEK